MSVNLPLRCMVSNGELVIRIGVDTLAFCASEHPEFYDGEKRPGGPNIIVTDKALFASEVALAMNRELGEDGSTLLTRCLDKAMAAAVEDGCKGVDHEEMS